MSKIISSIDVLFDALKFDTQHPTIVSIDGNMGVGKSTLAREIADGLGFDIFDLDCYLSEKVTAENGYVGTICFNNLLRDVEESLFSMRSIIVEGVCVLNVLERIGINPSVKIYVDEIDFAADSNFVRQRSSTVILEDIPNGAYLSCEIQRYHKSMTPYKIADIVFERYNK
ncbi:MAG: shikimate kinase [Thermodesulfobacteriota bacterium]